jgi:hypothetical protein
MTSTETDQATPTAVALPAPCWWIDRGDCWEITHHDSREDAEANHADSVRADDGWILSIAGAFEIVPGVARQEPCRCYKVTCPDCGAVQHHQTRFATCVGECGYEFEITQIPLIDPDQTRLFEALPTHGV